MLKSQSLLAHTQEKKNIETNSSIKSSNQQQIVSQIHSKKDQIPSLNITEVTEFQTRNKKSSFHRINSWSPSTTPSRFVSSDESDSQNDIFSQSNNKEELKNRPISSERYLKSSQSFSFTPKSPDSYKKYNSNNTFNNKNNDLNFYDIDDVNEIEDDNSSEDNFGGDYYYHNEVNYKSHTSSVKRYPRKIHTDLLNESPELIQQKLEEMGSDVKYSYQDDFLNEE